MPRMRAGLLLVTLATAWTVSFAAGAAVAPVMAQSPPLILEVRVFNGVEEVTSQTRISIHRAGDHATAVAHIKPAAVPHEAQVEPGLYDIQAIRERDGRAVSIRWVERLSIMPYPDEEGRHLEIINFVSGYGALEVVRQDRQAPDAAVYPAGEHTHPAATAVRGQRYVLFVLPSGRYDLETRHPFGGTSQASLEVPVDHTRLWVVR
jgi:hypothetical protein